MSLLLKKIKLLLMLNLKMLLCVFLLLCGTIVFAQDRTITGKVVSTRDNTGLVGATVTVKGRTSGTSTANDGTFSILAPSGQVTLQVSSVVI
jgi:hypothetical protein